MSINSSSKVKVFLKHGNSNHAIVMYNGYVHGKLL